MLAVMPRASESFAETDKLYNERLSLVWEKSQSDFYRIIYSGCAPEFGLVCNNNLATTEVQHGDVQRQGVHPHRDLCLR